MLAAALCMHDLLEVNHKVHKMHVSAHGAHVTAVRGNIPLPLLLTSLPTIRNSLRKQNPVLKYNT